MCGKVIVVVDVDEEIVKIIVFVDENVKKFIDG